MREDCKHFQSRMCADGEVASFCVLGLAPEAPWRCPADCPRYVHRLGDAGPPQRATKEPALTREVIALLDQVDQIVHAAAPHLMTGPEDGGDRPVVPAPSVPWWRRFRHRRP